MDHLCTIVHHINLWLLKPRKEKLNQLKEKPKLLDNIHSKMLPYVLQLCRRIKSYVSKSVVDETKQALQVAGSHLIKDEKVN